jgi:hypothetical protein
MLQNDPLRLPPFDILMRIRILLCHFDAEPNPAFLFDADPDPASQNDTDSQQILAAAMFRQLFYYTGSEGF